METVRIESKARRLLFLQDALGVYPNNGDHYGQPFCVECAVDHCDGGCKPECCTPWSLVDCEPFGTGTFGGGDSDYPIVCVGCEKFIDVHLSETGVDRVVEHILETQSVASAEKWTHHKWKTDQGGTARIWAAWFQRHVNLSKMAGE